jgi:mersacidin/lichenicidin family type 2 lantibiotic
MKKNIDVARAWRDEDYFLSLTEEERAGLGTHPAGVTSLQDTALKSISGGCCNSYNACSSAACTPCPPFECY